MVFLKMSFWNLIKCECECWVGGVSSGFDSGENESEEEIWREEDQENDICEVDLWTFYIDWEGTVWTFAGDRRITDVEEGTVGKATSMCDGEDEIPRHGKIDKDEGGCHTVRGGSVINVTGELLVGCGSSPQWK